MASDYDSSTSSRDDEDN
jgi:hypothetical protein